MAATVNAHRLKIYRLLLTVGLVITFLTSITILAWHEHIIQDGAPNHPFFNPSRNHKDGPMQQQSLTSNNNNNNDQWPPVLSVYMEPPSTTDVWFDNPTLQKPTPKSPLPIRQIHRSNLTRLTFPQRMSFSSLEAKSSICDSVPALLPIDEFGDTIRDPYLPWIHDLFVSSDGKYVNVIGQNRRRCHKGKFHGEDLKYWEGQVSLVSIIIQVASQSPVNCCFV